VLADFEDISHEDLFSWSDVEELEEAAPGARGHNEDIEML
jgi:hypothetical protein